MVLHSSEIPFRAETLGRGSMKITTSYFSMQSPTLFNTPVEEQIFEMMGLETEINTCLKIMILSLGVTYRR